MSRRGRRRARIAVVGAVAALVLVAGLVVAALNSESPAQRAAAARPPAARPVVAQVITRILRTEVVVRADVVPLRSILVAGAAVSSSDHAVVSGTPKRDGDTVDVGDVAIVVSGRPVIVLPGDVPMYRDLTPGASGPDVAAIQRALAAMGHPAGDPSGVYGAATQAAVAAVYERAGFEAPRDAAADAAVDSARSSLAEATRAVQVAVQTADGSRRERDGRIASARSAVAAALRRRAATGAAVVRDEDLQQRKVDAAHAAAAGGDVDLVLAAEQADNDLAALRDAGVESIAAADQAIVDAQAAFGEAQALPSAEFGIQTAQAGVESAQRSLDDALGHAGVVLPRSEVVVAPQLPAVISEVRPLGASLAATDAVFGLDSVGRCLEAKVDPDHLGGLKPGLSASTQLDGREVDLRIESIRALTTSPPSGGDGPTSTSAGEDAGAVVRFVGATPIDSHEGSVPVSVSLRPPIGPALVVPRSAVGGTDGATKIVTFDGRRRRVVPVVVLGESDGFVAVRPESGALADGDDVIVE